MKNSTVVTKEDAYTDSVPVSILIEKIKELAVDEPGAAPIVKSDRTDKQAHIELRTSDVFLTVGIPPHIKGYNYLREAVLLSIADPAILGSITKKLYPSIALKFDTSASKVERAMRHAIEVAWNRGRIEKLNAIFGVTFYLSGDKPTNAEFIALVSDRILQEIRLGKLD